MAEELTGRRALVCGVAVAGASAARALLAAGAVVDLCATAEGPLVPDLVAAGARWLGAITAVPPATQLVVTSPGLKPHDPLLVDAAERGIPVWGEIELAWRLRPEGGAPWLAITGTNGKTTTVHMLEAILRAAGLRAAAVGNVGVPVIDAVLAWPSYDVLAVELSSQQLHFAPSLRPEAGALLNLADDHLDWHGNFGAYAAAKTGVWRAEVAIGNADDARVAALLAATDVPVRVSFTTGDPDGGLGVRDGWLISDAFGDDAVRILPVGEVRPAGAHNVANALAAAALARAHGIGVDAIAAGLRDFSPDPHRNQLVGTFGGVTYIDDSKATNAHAARASLLSYDDIVWIAGGQLKGATVDELVIEIRDRLVGVVILGVDRYVIAEALQRHAPQIPVIDVSTRDDGAMLSVVRAAAGLARPGGTVLLAPAAASYDMFANYGARGDAFAAAARGLA